MGTLKMTSLTRALGMEVVKSKIEIILHTK